MICGLWGKIDNVSLEDAVPDNVIDFCASGWHCRQLRCVNCGHQPYVVWPANIPWIALECDECGQRMGVFNLQYHSKGVVIT